MALAGDVLIIHLSIGQGCHGHSEARQSIAAHYLRYTEAETVAVLVSLTQTIVHCQCQTQANASADLPEASHFAS